MFCEIVAQRALASPVAGVIAVFLDDKAANEKFSRLPILIVGSVIAYQRIRHRNDLLMIRWVRQDLLIAAHGSIEHNLTALLALSAKGTPFKNRTVLK